MRYLDFARLAALDDEAFRATKPYPWLSGEALLTAEGFQRLIENLPEVAMFASSFGVPRSHGQRPHDRYVLEYEDDVPVPVPWRELIEELRGDQYGRFLRRMFGRGRLELSFHWHYTPNGCSVSPHCDAVRKLGSHIFYLNTVDDWDPAWGGETLILDDGGRFDRKSAPRFEDFDHAYAAPSLGNRSLLFARREQSWHGVREIQCPEGKYRKVFIVVINDRAHMIARRAVAALTGARKSGY